MGITKSELFKKRQNRIASLAKAFGAATSNAQDYWDKIPALTSACYADKDDFGKKIHELKSEIKDRLERSKQATEEKVSKMTAEQRMAIATRYQNMKPEEIVKQQSEMMAMTQAQTEFQQSAAEIETSFNDLESDFRSAFGKRLGSIESEYRKLPDGEGTPQWAIKKRGGANGYVQQRVRSNLSRVFYFIRC